MFLLFNLPKRWPVVLVCLSNLVKKYWFLFHSFKRSLSLWAFSWRTTGGHLALCGLDGRVYDPFLPYKRYMLLSQKTAVVVLANWTIGHEYWLVYLNNRALDEKYIGPGFNSQCGQFFVLYINVFVFSHSSFHILINVHLTASRP